MVFRNIFLYKILVIVLVFKLKGPTDGLIKKL